MYRIRPDDPRYNSPRQDALLRILRDGREHTADELAAAIGDVSLNTFRTALTRLRRRGFPIILLCGQRHAFRLMIYEGVPQNAPAKPDRKTPSAAESVRRRADALRRGAGQPAMGEGNRAVS